MNKEKTIDLMCLSFLDGLDYATQMSSEEKEKAYQSFKNNANFILEVVSRY